MSRRLLAVVVAALLGLAAAAFGIMTPGPAVTDANVAARVAAIPSPRDHLALAQYYKAKAQAEDARIEATDHLFRAYMQLEGKLYEPLREQARKLLRAARESKKRYELLFSAHQNMAFEMADGAGVAAVTPTPHR